MHAVPTDARCRASPTPYNSRSPGYPFLVRFRTRTPGYPNLRIWSDLVRRGTPLYEFVRACMFLRASMCSHVRVGLCAWYRVMVAVVLCGECRRYGLVAWCFVGWVCFVGVMFNVFVDPVFIPVDSLNITTDVRTTHAIKRCRLSTTRHICREQYRTLTVHNLKIMSCFGARQQKRKTKR